LAWLARNQNGESRVSQAWEHSQAASFGVGHRELIENARLFSEVTSGAMLLYGLQLARIQERGRAGGLADTYLESYGDFARLVPIREVREWDLGRFWGLVLGKGHAIGPKTVRFVESWVAMVRRDHLRLFENAEALALVKEREMDLKRHRSRFSSESTLEQWNGHSGLRAFNYRWPAVQALMNDLALARGRAENA
jgi:hypothetical protein